MDTSTEQLVRDYLNRLAVAARRSLGPGEVMAFIGRMRGAIERQIGPQGAATPAEVATMLAALGRPEGLVQLDGRDGWGVCGGKGARAGRGGGGGGDGCGWGGCGRTGGSGGGGSG